MSVKSIIERWWTKELLILGPIYFFLSFINLRVKLALTPSWFSGGLAENHWLLMHFQYTNNEQSRILQYLIPELFSRVLSLDTVRGYTLQRSLFVFLAFVCFHLYLRKWFSALGSITGVVLLAALMPLTYIDDLQESSPLLLVTFLLGLWAIREDKLIALAAVLLIGVLNNETMLILPSVFFFYHFERRGWRQSLVLVRRTLLISLPMLVAITVVRYLTRDSPHLGGFWWFDRNLEMLAVQFSFLRSSPYRAYFYFIIFLYNALWLYALLGYRRSPLFLQRAAWMVPIFVLIHFLVGNISETRQMLPISFIVLPMALIYILQSLGDTQGLTQSDSL